MYDSAIDARGYHAFRNAQLSRRNHTIATGLFQRASFLTSNDGDDTGFSEKMQQLVRKANPKEATKELHEAVAVECDVVPWRTLVESGWVKAKLRKTKRYMGKMVQITRQAAAKQPHTFPEHRGRRVTDHFAVVVPPEDTAEDKKKPSRKEEEEEEHSVPIEQAALVEYGGEDDQDVTALTLLMPVPGPKKQQKGETKAPQPPEQASRRSGKRFFDDPPPPPAASPAPAAVASPAVAKTPLITRPRLNARVPIILKRLSRSLSPDAMSAAALRVFPAPHLKTHARTVIGLKQKHTASTRGPRRRKSLPPSLRLRGSAAWPAYGRPLHLAIEPVDDVPGAQQNEEQQWQPVGHVSLSEYPDGPISEEGIVAGSNSKSTNQKAGAKPGLLFPTLGIGLGIGWGGDLEPTGETSRCLCPPSLLGPPTPHPCAAPTLRRGCASDGPLSECLAGLAHAALGSPRHRGEVQQPH